MTVDVAELRDNIANFDDFFRPLRNYFYWEPHCFNIPVCYSIRSIFDTLDGIDIMTDDIQKLIPDMERLDALMPQMVTLMPPMIETMKTMRTMMLTMYATQKGMQDQMAAQQENSSAMGEAFDASMNDDSFYLPPEVFDNAEFKKGMENFISPDGKSVRFIIAHDGDPMTPEGIDRIDAIKQAAKEAIKGTPLEGSTVYLAGTAAVFKDMSDGSLFDLLIAAIASLGLIFVIMLIITRSVVGRRGHRRHGGDLAGRLVRALGTDLAALARDRVALDGAGDVGHHPVGRRRRLQSAAGVQAQRRAACGLNTGIIRAMGGSGSVVTSAGLVFAFTMMSMAVSELTVIGQVGTTIGLGLLFDTLVIRSFMTPSIAALMGKWFWWPQRVRARPVPSPWPQPPQQLAHVGDEGGQQ